MEKKGQEIRFMNKFLKSQTKTVNPKQWKRKQTTREDQCDICSRTFVNKQGVNNHKKRIHGISAAVLTKTRISTSLKLENSLTRSESLCSATGSSWANSPPPKKRVSEDKEDKKTKEDTSEKSSMEHSGGINERKGDQKVDFSNQCNIGETGELNDLKMNLARSREEVSELKKEKVQLKAHNARKHAGYEAELNEILIEKERFKVEVVKLQSERDLLLAKVTSMENDNDANEVDEQTF